jgi:simple sugar transport system ATP-binding protein
LNRVEQNSSNSGREAWRFPYCGLTFLFIETENHDMEKIPLLEMKGITKRFENVLANDSIDLKLYPGKIHALLGENGSGKSTLMNILLGIYKPNVGAFYFNGEKVSIKNPKHVVSLGIGMVHQHFVLIPPLSVAENIFLSMHGGGFILNTTENE